MSLGPLEKSQLLHESDPNYSLPSGYSAQGNIKSAMKLPWALKSMYSKFAIQTFLDYGCGKNGLVTLLKSYKDFSSIDFRSYDPAVAEYADKPSGGFDIVTCIDVLEHISRGEISQVLCEISGLTRGFFFFAIDLVPAVKYLDDRRNAHILLAPGDWWCQQISSQFTCTRFFLPGCFESGEKYPMHLFGWATNSPNCQCMANSFFDSIGIFSREWVCGSGNYKEVVFKKV